MTDSSSGHDEIICQCDVLECSSSGSNFNVFATGNISDVRRATVLNKIVCHFESRSREAAGIHCELVGTDDPSGIHCSTIDKDVVGSSRNSSVVSCREVNLIDVRI
ncbi:hypothetical protein D3C87_1292420 [compost metagenome]